MTDMTQGRAAQQSPFRTSRDLRETLKLPARPLLRSESLSEPLRTQVKIAAVTAAAQLFQGTFPTREGDMEEFLSCAADIEDWINER